MCFHNFGRSTNPLGRCWGAKSSPRRPRRCPINPQEAQEQSTGAKKRSPSLQETIPREPKEPQSKLQRPRKGPQEPKRGPQGSKKCDYGSTQDSKQSIPKAPKNAITDPLRIPNNQYTKQSIGTVAGGPKAIGYIYIYIYIYIYNPDP